MARITALHQDHRVAATAEMAKLAQKIRTVPEHDAVQILSAHCSDQLFDEGGASTRIQTHIGPDNNWADSTQLFDHLLMGDEAKAALKHGTKDPP